MFISSRSARCSDRIGVGGEFRPDQANRQHALQHVAYCRAGVADPGRRSEGDRLDDADHIGRNARVIGRNAAWSSAMLPGNITDMTSSGRAIIAAWLAAGARVR